MSDMADNFRAMRAHRNRGKAEQGLKNKQLLVASGLEHLQMDMFDTHYHVTMPDGTVVSFWPTTGAWREHTAKARTRHGFEDMMAFKKLHEAK